MSRIVLADDHAIVREGLKRILDAAEGFEVVGEAADGAQVMQRVREVDFDLLVLDLSMPGRSGMELIKLVKAEKPRLRILVLSMHQEMQYAVRAIKSGASGYLTKESAPAELEQALRKIASGGAYVTADVAQQLALGAMPGSQAAPHESLSTREFEVFQQLVAGASVTDIAGRLNLSVKTVSTHKSNLMHKLGLANPTELLRYAMKHGLADAIEEPAEAAAIAVEAINAGGNAMYLTPEGETARWAVEAALVAEGITVDAPLGVPVIDLLVAEVEAYAAVGLFGGVAPDIGSMVDATVLADLYDGDTIIWPAD